MRGDVLISELWEAIERTGRSNGEFHIAFSQREPGWVTVKGGNTTRNYPAGRETAVLLSSEIRHGIFDRVR